MNWLPFPKRRRPSDHGITSAVGGVRLHKHRRGVDIAPPDTMQLFVGAFAVSKGSYGRLRVGVGTINDQIPLIDGTPIDGVKNEVQGEVPLLTADGPGEQLRSYVTLVCRTDAKGQPLDDETAYTIEHRKTKTPRHSGLIVDDGTFTGSLELALILWDASENIRMIVQNVHANKVHVFQPGAKGAKGLHFFFSPDDITAA